MAEGEGLSLGHLCSSTALTIGPVVLSDCSGWCSKLCSKTKPKINRYNEAPKQASCISLPGFLKIKTLRSTKLLTMQITYIYQYFSNS